MTDQIIPAYVINLDRRTDRARHMERELGQAGITYTRVSALDAQVATDAEIGKEVALNGAKIGMGRGSQCCAITNFDIYRTLLATDAPAALILQDDIAIDPDLRLFLTDLDWLPAHIGLVQFEKFGRARSTRLAGPAQDCGRAGRKLHQMYSRTAGAGCYLITRHIAQLILDQKPLLNMPIDHFLFSPNVSPLFKKMNVGFVAPAMARQKMEAIASDLAQDRTARISSKTLAQRLRRLGQETNKVPQQLWAMAKGARMVEFSVPAALLNEAQNVRD